MKAKFNGEGKCTVIWLDKESEESGKYTFLASQTSRAIADAFYRQRAPYRLKTIGGARQDNGALKLYCPASTLAKHAISCANKPASQNPSLRPGRINIGTALPVINTAPTPTVCEQSTVTVPFDEVPFWQPHIPYTVEHDHSMGRRNQVESSYARIKDPATQSVRRGNFRVVGITKVSFVILLAAMAASGSDALSIALVHTWFNVIGILVLFGIPFLRPLPIRAAELLAEIAVRRRTFAFLWVLGMFIIVPLIGVAIFR